MPKNISIEIEGGQELIENGKKLLNNFENVLYNGLRKAMENTANNIQSFFKGGGSPGFQDRTGALRASIVGGIADEISTPNNLVGFVGAGNSDIGSNGRQTKEYVEDIEYGEFKHAGRTSFLRSGVQMFKNDMVNIIENEVGEFIGRENINWDKGAVKEDFSRLEDTPIPKLGDVENAMWRKQKREQRKEDKAYSYSIGVRFANWANKGK